MSGLKSLRAKFRRAAVQYDGSSVKLVEQRGPVLDPTDFDTSVLMTLGTVFTDDPKSPEFVHFLVLGASPRDEDAMKGFKAIAKEGAVFLLSPHWRTILSFVNYNAVIAVWPRFVFRFAKSHPNLNAEKQRRISDPFSASIEAIEAYLASVKMRRQTATKSPPSPPPPSQPVPAQPDAGKLIGFAGMGDIMKQFSIPQKHYTAIDGRLKRLRKTNRGNSEIFVENDAPAKNRPRFLYNLATVAPLIADLLGAPDTAPNEIILARIP